MEAFTFVLILLAVVFAITKCTEKKKKGSGGAQAAGGVKLGGRGSAASRHSALCNPDRFKTTEEVTRALRTAGLESSNLIFAVDFTKSNVQQGERTFGNRCLHHLDPIISNPYQKVMSLLGQTLEPFDEDHLIPTYGFGDITTKDRAVFSFNTGELPCRGAQQVLDRYAQIVPSTQLSGPTSFAPAIDKAIEIVKREKSYHILVIIADGQVTNERTTRDAIVRAANYPLSIIVVGVGDGPWDTMKEFDDSIPARKFDNFQFVDFHRTVSGSDFPDAAFALNALMEIPDQFAAIRSLGLLDM